MKTCSDCSQSLPLDAFTPKASCRDGYEPRCKRCRSIRYNKSTPERLCKKIYHTQINHSIKRGHSLPAYTLEEITKWVTDQPKFSDLFSAWVASGYQKDLAPSVDRLDDTKPYAFDNICLTTWSINRQKGADSKREGKLSVGHKPVAAYTKDGQLHREYLSINDALRDVKGNMWGITSVANGVPVKDGRGQPYMPRSYKGFVWVWL